MRAKGEGVRGVGNVDAHVALANGAERFEQRRHIEDVAHALAICLRQNGEGRIAGGDGEQVVGSLALLPQRRAALRATAWQEQSPGCTLTKFRRKQRGAAELAQNQVRGLFRIEKNQLGVRRSIAVRKAQDESIVAPHRFHIGTATGTNAAGDRHGPGRVHAAAKRGEHADAPVAQFVTRALDDDGAVIWNYRGSNFLSARKRMRFSAAMGSRSCSRIKRLSAALRGMSREFADQLANAAAKFEGAAGIVSMPERHLARLARRRRNQYPVVGDLVDAPGRRAQDKGVAGAAFEDHLFVEFIHADGLAFRPREKDAVEAAIGNSAAVQDGQGLDSFARRQGVARCDPR